MRYKALTLALGFILCNQASAFSPDCCMKDYSPGLCSPKLPGGFYIGLSGLSLRPTETNLGQANDSWQFLESDDPADLVFRADDKLNRPSQKWAWEAIAGYDFPCTSYNIEARYLHLSNKTHAVTTTDDGDPVSFSSITITNFILPIDDPTTTSILFLKSDSNLRYTTDQFDIKVGKQFLDPCGPFKLQASLGARYANLDHQLTFNSPITLAVVVDDITIVADGTSLGAYKSRFKGIGPLGSLDTRYALGRWGIGLVGHFDAGLLIGDTSSSAFLTQITTPEDPIFGSTATITNRFHRPTVKRLVPTLDAKLGLDYTVCFCNKSSLTLEAGYSANRYWDTFDLIRGDVSQTVDVLAQKITSVTTNSFSVYGPYAQLTWHI